MPLTKKQMEVLAEAQEIAELTEFSFDDIEKHQSKTRLIQLQSTIRQLVIGEVVTQYTLLDEIMADTIVDYFFHTNDDEYPKLWRTKPFRIFVHHILDEMFFLKKAAVAHAIQPIPSEIMKTLHTINAVRNALAHSFFPENRKEYRKHKLVVYNGKHIHRPDGLRLFKQDASNALIISSSVTGGAHVRRGIEAESADRLLARLPAIASRAYVLSARTHGSKVWLVLEM